MGSRDAWIVLIIWMPATTPICMVSCAAALAIPRFDSSTALAMLAVMDGEAMPDPSYEVTVVMEPTRNSWVLVCFKHECLAQISCAYASERYAYAIFP